MKSSLESLSPTRVKLSVEVPFSELDDQLAEAYKRIASEVNIPGFRRGKVPARVIDQRFGRGTVLQEAVNEALPGFYEAAVLEHEVKVMGRPEVEVTDLVDGEQLVFSVEVDVQPEFDLPDYEGIAVEVKDASVGEDEIDRQLDELRKRFATVKPTDRPVADGDLVQLDIAGSIDGEPIEDYSISSYSHEIGSGGLIEGIDEVLAGVSAGETVDFTFQPEGGPHAGTDVNLNLTVSEVREREMPAADDDFAQLASEFDTLDELIGDLSDRLARMRLMEQAMSAREKALDVLLAAVDIQVPEGVVQAQVEEHFEQEHGEGHAHDAEVDDVDAHRSEVAEDVGKAVRAQLLLDRIADAEAVAVGQEELTRWLVSQAPKYGMSPDDFAQALVQAGQVQSAVAEVRRAKAIDLVVRKAKITDESGKPVDLTVLDPKPVETDAETETGAETETDTGADAEAPAEDRD